MQKERNMYWASSPKQAEADQNESRQEVKCYMAFSLAALCLLFSSCDLIKRKSESETDNIRPSVARVGETYLYLDELTGIVPPGTPKADSITRMEAYVNSWVRKQLLIRQAGRQIDINKAEVERKLLDYRYSLIAYEFQTYYIKQNLDTVVAQSEIEQYYKEHLDNFVLKQNIVRATFLKVPQSAPRTKKVKDLIFSTKEKDVEELKSYCLSFAASYHLSDSSWMEFDELVKGTPLVGIPDKVQFLKRTPYYETNDEAYLYFLKVDEYRISDNVSPLQFVRDDIVNVILNRRKVELAKKLEEEVYSKAQETNEFELFNK
ncbi:peptidyl-prolyl cis-trans isomerase [Chryseotalea sanaruensis]|uniref:Peptidyl-prolyl cis-trans isomerase n=1 Tax=Chryseotalea sanaruensis TaxID=2482724 RepID=A0A401U8P5_9BACT|nr:peptidyl-prolyl cis-trans isomerase [Chryseotalea sanaruensis]GCC51260.1 peptidyl-prolyl cis-trans isomerase [Chryseotalea sanaruensis]